MLIVIDISVKNHIEANEKDLKWCSSIISALNSIARAYVYMKHLVITDIESLEYFSECKILDEGTRKLFTHFLSKQYTFDDIKGKCKCKIIAHKNNQGFYINNDEYWVPIEQLNEIKETVLISENNSDCSFYEQLCKKMISESSDNNSLNICFNKISCSGSHAYVAAENEIQKNNIVFMLMDSDKNHHEDDVGESLKNARKICNKYKDKYYVYLFETNFREKENIIPPSFYLLFNKKVNNAKFIEYLGLLEKNSQYQEILRYLNIKDGIQSKIYKNSDSRWKTVYNDFFRELDQNNFLIYKLNDIGEINDDIIILEGIGNKAVEKFTSLILCGGLSKEKEKLIFAKSNGRKISEWQIKSITDNEIKIKKLFNILPEYIKNDWYLLCREILIWGCCASDTQIIFNA